VVGLFAASIVITVVIIGKGVEARNQDCFVFPSVFFLPSKQISLLTIITIG
jgi:hypothetical protein